MNEQTDGWRDHLARFGKAVINEAVLPAAEKLIPQGASEVAQALYTGNAFVPYGPTNQPVSMESPGLYGEATQQPASYESELQKYVTLDPEQQPSRGADASSLYGPKAAPETEQSTTYESELQRYASRTPEQEPERSAER